MKFDQINNNSHNFAVDSNAIMVISAQVPFNWAQVGFGSSNQIHNPIDRILEIYWIQLFSGNKKYSNSNIKWIFSIKRDMQTWISIWNSFTRCFCVRIPKNALCIVSIFPTYLLPLFVQILEFYWKTIKNKAKMYALHIVKNFYSSICEKKTVGIVVRR